VYVDAHAHLVHPAFEDDADAVAERATASGVGWVIVNGLNHDNNVAVLELCQRHRGLLPALGLYPVDAGAAAIDREAWTHAHYPAPEPVDLDATLAFIAAQRDAIVAIGEVGLDAYWAPETLPEQERVLRRVCRLGVALDLPLILHTRKAERRCFEILQEEGVRRADFHCFGGKVKLGLEIAEAGYYLSIPPVIERARSFQALAQALPLDRLLTETDCPYQGPDRGERNEPAQVVRGVAAIAAARGAPVEAVREAIWTNFQALFRPERLA
jgi:TatD DNase family protein